MSARPLASRMRPTRIEDLVGQDHLLEPGRPLARALTGGQLHSMILWGPPGCGKTTLARIVAARAKAHVIQISAVLAGVKDLREAVKEAQSQAQPTVLFIDEIHRFNKAQQDALLPHVESGLVTLIGATTENPAFELRSALLSRARVYVLKAIDTASLMRLVQRALSQLETSADPHAVEILARTADGDARRAIGLAEIATQLSDGSKVTEFHAQAACEGSLRRFDKGGDSYFDQLSALHKSIRTSDPDGAAYWVCRLLDGGCDPRTIARRLVRVASEDVGNADPRGLELALHAWQSFERLGSPEGELALVQAALYLACCAKSNASYLAMNKAMDAVRKHGSLEVPLHLRNAPTGLARDLGHGKGYRYDHDEPDGIAWEQSGLPEELHGQVYYQPVERGLEIRIAEKLARIRARRSD